MKPKFIIAGIMKSGTTFLDGLLRNHPGIGIPDRNMDHSFFDDDRIYPKGMEWYENLFSEFENQKDKVIGQTSADCAFNKGSIQRIKEHIPDVKLIFVLRHPIDRSYSLYWHQYSMGREYRTFENALKREPKVIGKSYYNYKMYSYLERSRYKAQFDNVFNHFNKDQVLIVPFNALTKNTLPTLNRVLRFLDVNEIQNLEELSIKDIPRNRARIPKNKEVVALSSFLQSLGMVRLGRRIINLNRVEGRPPVMNQETRLLLEKELKDDILFYTETTNQFKEIVT